MLLSNFAYDAAHLAGMVGVKAGRPLIGLFARAVPLVGGVINRSWIKVFVIFARDLWLLKKVNGMGFVVTYLKTCSVLLQQFIGGQRLRSLTPFGV
jgi:hypothetical protein